MNLVASENIKTSSVVVHSERVEFISEFDGLRDWYLVVPGKADQPSIINLHGHGSSGDQAWTRPDIRRNLEAMVGEGMTVISPNLRGNAWMSPAAAADMAQIIKAERGKRTWTKTFFVAGSMGGTSALAFAALRPELVDGVVALGAATDIGRYETWCRRSDLPSATAGIRSAIADAIASAYGTADKAPHSASGNANRLRMPIVLIHGEADTLIPVEEARDLAKKLEQNPRFTYREIPSGNHDSPLELWSEALNLLNGILVTSLEPLTDEAYPQGTIRINYTSRLDGEKDWALFLPGDTNKNTVVYLHGSFSEADQIFTRADIRDFWLSRIIAGGHPLLSVNMRGTSYMSPAATADMTGLLYYARENLACKNFTLLGGSGGASSAMAYTVVAPENVHGVIAMGMCDIFARLDFAKKSRNMILQKLAWSAYSAYRATPEERPELYEARSVLLHTDKLTMPIVLTIGENDSLIPVAETRKIASAMEGKKNFVYHEVPKGNHDSALWIDIDLETFQIKDQESK